MKNLQFERLMQDNHIPAENSGAEPHSFPVDAESERCCRRLSCSEENNSFAAAADCRILR